MSGDIVVDLRGGTYALQDTFTLTAADSGFNGNQVIYRARAGERPVISGGTDIGGWAVYDQGKNIYRAFVGSLDTRQLYVDGARAVRARSAGAPSGWQQTDTGYVVDDPSSVVWGNAADVEVVWRVEWTESRCGVASVSGNVVSMSQPCYDFSRLDRPGVRVGQPAWIENAYELLDQPQEWYLDRSEGYLYYQPDAGQSMDSVSVVAPRLQTLLRAAGTPDAPVRDLAFEGLQFSYATWLGPNSDEGFSEVQANFTITSSSVTATSPYRATPYNNWTKTPANVTFAGTQRVRLERNTFTHLGAAGLGFEAGSKNNVVVGNVFTDISGSGLQIGDVNAPNPGDERLVTEGNQVTNNFITTVAAEYHGGVGIWQGYVRNGLIAHNEITNLPYSGISNGWGWIAEDTVPNIARNNRITNNLVYNVNNLLRDGGGIYTLGTQGTSLSDGLVIEGNVVHDVVNVFNGIYTDEGSRFITISGNVLYNNRSDIGGCQPFGDFLLIGNFWEKPTPDFACAPLRYPVVFQDNTVISGPQGAPAAIVAAAGLQTEYQGIRSGAAVNLALGRTASASSVFASEYAAGKANDGSARGSSGWSPLGVGDDPRPWWQVDLGRPSQIGRIELVTRQEAFDDPPSRRNFEVRASNDPTFASYVVLGAQGTDPVPFGGSWNRQVSDTGAYQYLRVTKTADEYFFISEFRVFGATVNVETIGGSASASSEYSQEHAAGKANDGSVSGSSGWSPLGVGDDPRPWWQLDLGRPSQISRIELLTRQGAYDDPVSRRNFEVRASNDPTFASYVVLGAQGSDPVSFEGSWNRPVSDTGAYRYLRVAKTVDEYFFISEFRVSGPA